MVLFHKTCTRCAKTKVRTEFSVQSSKLDGLRPECKRCGTGDKRRYREDHPEAVAQAQAKWLARNPGYKAQWYAQNSGYNHRYYIENKERLIAGSKQYRRERLQENPQYRLADGLRARLYSAIANDSKSGSAVRDLGCSIADLKQYLESKFQPGMTWANYGLYGWHIDHIKPLAKFDLTDRAQLLEACHYTNLQPLWATENLRKGKNG